MLRIKKEYSEYLTKTFRIPTEIISRLDSLSHEYNTSMNKVVIQCLEYALDNISDEEKPDSLQKKQ